MPSILESVEWGKKPLDFLSGPMKNIQSDLPAIILLRHSQTDYSNASVRSEAILTNKGKQAAYEFGSKLPSNFTYRIFHSKYPRARMTAERIHDGIIKQNGTSTIVGSKQYLVFSQSDTDKISLYWDRDGKRLLDNWISKRYPPWEVESCSELAKRVAYEIGRNLGESGPGQIDLYVSHDIIISPLMFFWLGVYKHYDWMGYLDGFILQLCEDKMRYLDKDGEHEVYYPYWWKLIS